MPRTRNISIGVSPELHAMYAGLGLPDRRRLLEDVRALLRSHFQPGALSRNEAGGRDGETGQVGRVDLDQVRVSDFGLPERESAATIPVSLPAGW